MCRNIRVLHNFEPPASDDEVRAAALQYVRKVSGYNRVPKVNEEVFAAAVDEIYQVTTNLLDTLKATAPPKDREVELEKKRARFAKRQR